MRLLYHLVARGLTLGRFAATLPFLYILFQTLDKANGQNHSVLALLYLAIAGSDLLDGFFARAAGTPSHRWGQMDALADILFNTSSLLVAAWFSLLGIWVPLGIIILATLFIHRNRHSEAPDQVRLSEDRLGKLAGIVYYLMVGAVVLSLWLETESARIALWWLGNLVFAYTLVVIIRNLLPRQS